MAGHSVNALNAAELHTEKWFRWLLYYVYFTTTKKSFDLKENELLFSFTGAENNIFFSSSNSQLSIQV